MDSIKRLIDLFSKFPTVGPRTASRFVFYLIKQPKERIFELADAISGLKNIKLCSFCFLPFENSNGTLCPICSNPSKDKQLLCIVEKEIDLLSIESKKKYNGLYFILGNESRIEALKERIKNSKKFGVEGNFKEIIIAINPTVESRSISFSVEKALKKIQTSIPNLKITHLAKGLPVGGELEYADEETLGEAFEGRR